MSSRKQVEIKTTMDLISDYTVRFAIANSTATLIYSTDMGTTILPAVPATSPGQFTIQFGANNYYPQLFDVQPSVKQAVSATGSYRLIEVSSDPTVGQVTLQLVGGPFGTNGVVTGQTAAEVAKASLTGSVHVTLRNTNRLV